MRKSIILIFSSILAFSGCETEIDAVDEADPTPVVYCVLNQDSAIQYLRLSRTYISYNASIPVDEPDSVLFARATRVAVEEIVGGEVTNRMFFTPVDVVKDSGFFPRQEHWIYRAEFKVKPETDYRLIIYVGEYDEIVYASCYSVGDFEILNPLYPLVRYIHMVNDHNLTFYWTKSNNAAIYQLGFLMHYLEIGETQTLEKQLMIPLNTVFYIATTDNNFSYSVNSTKFYSYIAEALPVDPSLLRQFVSLDALIICGGEELGYYMNMQQNDQIFSLADYTNIQTGVGVFSSKIVKKVEGFSLTDQSIDSLAYSEATYDLNFVDRTGTRDGR